MKGQKANASEYRAKLPWTARPFLLRAGGIYSVESPNLIRMANRTILGVNRDSQSALNLGLTLPSTSGRIAFQVVDNMILTPESPYDLALTPGGQDLKLYAGRRDIALHMHFSRIAQSALVDHLRKDSEESQVAAHKTLLTHLTRERQPVPSLAIQPNTNVIDQIVAMVDTQIGFDDEDAVMLADVRRFSASCLGSQLEIGIGISNGGTSVYFGVCDKGPGALAYGRDFAVCKPHLRAGLNAHDGANVARATSILEAPPRVPFRCRDRASLAV
ncbi:MAG: hypothetical protein ACREJD_08400 [Phycisphaerales bacterium]